jgi:DNA (cytosine-5)-methyltransferase 1
MGIVSAFLEQANTGMVGHDAREPVSTIVQKACTQRVVAASLVTLRGDNVGAAASDPLRTVSAGGEHHALVEYQLSPEAEAGALRVAAFLIRYYSEGGQWGDLREPLDTITTRDRLALVTVTIHGTPYVIVDIGLRMLVPKELFRAQGFRPTYIFDRGADGKPFPKTVQVRMVGNSISPPPYQALLRENFLHEQLFAQEGAA